MRKFLLFSCITILLAACSASRQVVPLNKNERAVSMSVGGPLINRDSIPLPVPNLSVAYAYGKSRYNTRLLAVHLSPMLYGTYYIEGGFLREWWYLNKSNIGFTSNLIGHFMLDSWQWNFKFYPEIDLNLYWHFKGDPHYFCDCPGDSKFMQFIYIGLNNWFELASKDEYDIRTSPIYLGTPHLGYNIGNKKVKFNIEAKYYLPYINKNSTGLNYFNPFNDYGAYGIHLAIYRLF